MKNRKLAAILLAACMVLSLLPAGALAEELPLPEAGVEESFVPAPEGETPPAVESEGSEGEAPPAIETEAPETEEGEGEVPPAAESGEPEEEGPPAVETEEPEKSQEPEAPGADSPEGEPAISLALLEEAELPAGASREEPETGVSIKGIAGLEGLYFDSMENAYNAVKAVLLGMPTVQGDQLVQGVFLNNEAGRAEFQKVFEQPTTLAGHEGVKLTWIIYGQVEIPAGLDSLYLSGGRAAAWYGSDEMTIREIEVVGGNSAAELILNASPKMPYQWWGDTTDGHIFFSAKEVGLTLNGFENKFFLDVVNVDKFDCKISACDIQGKLYHYFNGESTLTVENCTFVPTSSKETYALMAQGHGTKPLTINFVGNTVSGYKRGINIEQATAEATITGNTITPGTGYSAFQLSGCKSVLVKDNTVICNNSNVFTLHENLAKNAVEGRTITVKGNRVTGKGYLIYDDIAAVGKYSDSNAYLTFVMQDNDLAETIDTTQGIKLILKKPSKVQMVAETAGAQYNTLQRAIDAADAEQTVTLLKDAHETVVIDKDLILDGARHALTLDETAAAGMTKIEKITGEAMGYMAVIAATSNATVAVENLTIQSSEAVMDTLDRTFRHIGIAAINANVTVKNSVIKDMCYTDDVKGIQNGVGIYGVSDTEKTLTLDQVSITNFNKGGIVTRAKVDLEMEGCTVTGWGQTGLTAQNGVQYSGNAVIKNTTILGMQYNSNAPSATAIMSYPVGRETTAVLENVTVTDVDTAIYTYPNGKTEIKSGSFAGEMQVAAGTLAISGGSFTVDVNEYVVEGVQANEKDGVWTIGPKVDEDTVAIVGNRGFATLQAAVDAAEAGETVMVLQDTAEDVILPLKSITLTSQGESKPVLRGKMDFATGEMPEGAQVTIENLAFENTRIMLVSWGKTTGLDKMGGLTIRDNTFTGTPSGTDTIYAVHINNADNGLNNLTVTGNVFTDCGTGSGGAVYATVCGELVVTGNEFRNSAMNALTLTGKDSKGQVATSAVISENVFENWAAKPVDRTDGRAMRLSDFECDLDLTENSFESENLPEEYIKLTGLAEGKKADVNQCYWGGGAPGEGKLIGVAPVVSYYTTEAMEKSLTLSPDTVSVEAGSTATLTAASSTMGGTVVWSTDKAAVATVSESGVVTGVGAGSATITASLGAVTASCTVTVTQAGSGGSTGGGSGSGSGSSSRPVQPEEELEEPEVPLAMALPFADVAEGDWFLEAVQFVYQRDMMKGTNEEGTLFDPQTATTRGMIVTILHRLEGEPEAAGAAFSDVAEGGWYTGAVNWAAENGVVKGYEDGTFRPEGIITREETAAILSRYATFKGYDKTAKGNMEYYNDKTLISDWAQEDMVWAVGAKLLSGKENGLLDPRGETSRAEAAQMLKNFCEGFEKK